MTKSISQHALWRPSLRNCEDELIHIPGSIQGRGMLFGVDATGTVTHAAGELPGLAQASDAPGRPVVELLPELTRLLEQTMTASHHRFMIRDQRFVARSHQNDQGVRVLEIEPDDPADGTFTAKSFRSVYESGSVLETLQRATRALREMTGYDRVLAYVFDPDLNGTVLAEDQRPGINSFLHQRFPASDIPPQAMRLYRRKRVRLISDVDYEPQSIWGLPNAVSPLNLSDADLRSVSPIHIEYLRNMGVAGTLVCALMAEDEVLGMLTCHHLSPRYVTPTMRDAAEVFASAVSHRVQALRHREENASRVSSYRKMSRMLLDMTDDHASPDGLGTHVDQVRSLINAEGAAIILGSRVFASGRTPRDEDVLRISKALATASNGYVKGTDHLASVDPSLGTLSNVAAGVVRCSLIGEDDDAVLWFRPELIRNESWAGNPADSAVVATADSPLKPRKSFEIYVTKITGRSLAWQPWEIETAEAVRGLVSNVASRLRGLQRLAEERERTNQQLAETRDAALLASKAKSDFLANMSHEIRTPMTAILGFADLLANDLGEHSDQADEAVETIRANATHLLTLINDILDVSKIEAGQMKIESIDTSPIDVVEEVISLVRPRAAGKGIDLRVTFETPIPRTIRSDPVRIRQILFNLVGNAIKFTEHGSVEIALACVPEDARLSISVIDTGIGMSQEQLARISQFTAFTQADESTTRVFGGTGLGLRISNALAQLLDGGLSIRSRAGHGSTFTLTIGTGPLGETAFAQPSEEADSTLPPTAPTQDGASPRHSAQKTEEPPLAGVRILLAEDGPDNQRLISFVLRKAGANVDIAANGVEAVDAILTAKETGTRLDLVLMDMQMPHLDGYGATRRVRELGVVTPIIALTAHAMEGDRQRCLDAGCDEYLTKPIDRSALVMTCKDFARRPTELRKIA